MVGIIIATHADLGQAFLNAIALIAGQQEQVKVIGLTHEDSIEDFEQNVFQSLEELDSGDGVLAFVDFIGGTPANTMLKYMRNKDLNCIVGVNMPMLLEALTNRRGVTPDDLEKRCLKVGCEGIGSLRQILLNMMDSDEEEI